MNNQINFQPIHCHPINIQGYQIQQLHTPCHIFTSSPSFGSNRFAQIQTPQNEQTKLSQLNQGFEPSPSTRFLSTTAKVLKNQIYEFKQKMTQQPQQNNLIKNSIAQEQQYQLHNQGQPQELLKVNTGIVQIQQLYSQQKTGTPSSSSSSSTSSQQKNQINQGFGIVVHNYQRSSSASYNCKQSKTQYDCIQPQTTYAQIINGEQYIINNKIGHHPINAQNPSFAKQTQKQANYVVSQTQPSQIDFIDRRMSVPHDNRDEIERQSTRFSDDIRHRFSDSIQSVSANNQKATPISLISNYSPLLIENDIHIRSSIQSIINQPLQLDPQNHGQKGIQTKLEQIQNEDQNIKQVQNQLQNNNDKVIEHQHRTQKQQDNQLKENKESQPHQDSNSFLSQQLINLYIHKGSNDEIEVGDHFIQLLSSRQKQEDDFQVNQNKEQNLYKLNELNTIQKSNELQKRNNGQQDTNFNVIILNQNHQIKTNLIILHNQKKEEQTITSASIQVQQQCDKTNSIQQKPKPEKSLSKQNNGSNKNIQINVDQCQNDKKIQNIQSATYGKSKQNEKYFFVDDREIKTPYSPKEQYQEYIDKNKLGVNRRLSQEKKKKNRSSTNEKIKQNDNHFTTNEKIGNTSPFVINLCKQPKDTQNKLSSKKKQKKDQQVNDIRITTPKQVDTDLVIMNNVILQEYQMDKGVQNSQTPHRAYNYSSCKSNQVQTENMSASRQITFPESPISIPSKFDFSCGFGSDITYNEDMVQESVREYVQCQKQNILPLVVTMSQVQNEQNQNVQHSETINQLNNANQKILFSKLNKETEILENYNLNGKQNLELNLQISPLQNNYINPQLFGLDKDYIKQIENKQINHEKRSQIVESQQDKLNCQRVKLDDEEENEINPDFINLYKTPLKNYKVEKNEPSTKQYCAEIQDLKNSLTQIKAINSEQFKQTTVHKNVVFQETDDQIQSPYNSVQQKQGNIISPANENNQNNQNIMNSQNIIIQTQFQGNNNLKQQNQRNEKKIDQENTENNCLKQNEDQHTYEIELQKNKQIEETHNKQNRQDQYAELSQIKIPLNSYNSKQLIARRIIKNEKESIQSIHELLNFMGGLQPVSQFCTPLPTNNLLTKQNLSLVFDDKSIPPSKVCSLKCIQSEFNHQNDIISEQKQLTNHSTSQTSIKNKINTNQDQLKKDNDQKRQETPSKSNDFQQYQKINQNDKKQAPLKLQDLYTGQYQGVKQQYQMNNQKIENNLNKKKKQLNLNSFSGIENKNNNKKLENPIEDENKTENTRISSQLKKNVQNNTNKIENKNKNQKNSSSTLGKTGNSISQKSLQNKLDLKSMNSEKQKSSTTFQNSSSNYNSINSTIVKNSNLSKQTGNSNTNFANRTIEGNILADSLLKNNDDNTQYQTIQQKDESLKVLNQQEKSMQNNSQNSIQTYGKKQFSNRASFEIIQQEDKEDSMSQMKQFIAQYYDDEKEQPYMRFGQSPKLKTKDAIIVEDIYQDSPKKEGLQNQQSQQDTDRSLKSENQTKKENQQKQKNKQSQPIRKQSSLHEKSQKDAIFIINLDKGRNSISNNQQINQYNKVISRQKELDSSKSPNKNIQNNIPLFEFKVDKKQFEQINLKQNIQEQYSIQKQKSNHEIRQRPKSTQKGTIHNSVDKSGLDLFGSTDKIISVDYDNKKKMLTSNSPIIYDKNKKGISNYQLPSNSNKQFNFHNQFSSYSSNNHFKNSYQVNGNKSTQQNNNKDVYTHSFTQLLNSNQQSSSFQVSQKQLSGVNHIFSNQQQIQKTQSKIKENSINSPQKVYNLDKDVNLILY